MVCENLHVLLYVEHILIYSQEWKISKIIVFLLVHDLIIHKQRHFLIYSGI